MKRLAYWFRDKHGVEHRAKAETGSVTFKPTLAAKVRASIAKHGGKITRRTRTASTDHDAAVRDSITRWARHFANHEPQVHYTQGAGRMDAARIGSASLPLSTDCSGFYTLLCRLAGAPDPNGRGYDGTGYTGTLLTNMQPTTLDQIRAGDAGIYGDGTGDHIAVVLEPGPDPLLVSHGQEAGPILIRHSTEHAAQGGGMVRWLHLDTGT